MTAKVAALQGLSQAYRHEVREHRDDIDRLLSVFNRAMATRDAIRELVPVKRGEDSEWFSLLINIVRRASELNEKKSDELMAAYGL